MNNQQISFEEHQAAKRRSRALDEAALASGHVSRAELAERNGGLARFVKPGVIGASRKRLKSLAHA